MIFKILQALYRYINIIIIFSKLVFIWKTYIFNSSCSG